MIRKVYVETPYSGNIEENVDYAIRCMRDCLARGEAPFLSHLLYTQAPEGRGFVADDSEHVTSVGRHAAINAAQEWRKVADATVVYTDRGMSGGMHAGIAHAKTVGQAIEYRSLKKSANTLPNTSLADRNSSIVSAARKIACASDTGAPRTLSSERETRIRVNISPVPNSVFVDDEARLRYDHLLQLLRTAGDYKDCEVDNALCGPSKQDLHILFVHLLDATTQHGFHDIGTFLPDIVIWLSGHSLLSALAYLITPHQYELLWDAVCALGPQVCRVNLRSESFVARLAYMTDNNVCLFAEPKPRGYFSMEKFARSYLIPVKPD